MRTPLFLLVAGFALFAVGFGIGTAGVDPLSAWIGTLGMAVFAVGLVWLLVAALARRAGARQA